MSDTYSSKGGSTFEQTCHSGQVVLVLATVTLEVVKDHLTAHRDHFGATSTAKV